MVERVLLPTLVDELLDGRLRVVDLDGAPHGARTVGIVLGQGQHAVGGVLRRVALRRRPVDENRTGMNDGMWGDSASIFGMPTAP